MKDGIKAAHRLAYARGFLELGMAAHARGELERLSPEDAASWDALSVWMDLRMETREWAAVVDLAREYAQARPREDKGWICWAYALRELQRVSEARDVLLRAEALHGASCALLHYNLACYYCLLGDRAEATQRLRRAVGMQSGFAEDAKTDPDLRGLESD